MKYHNPKTTVAAIIIREQAGRQQVLLTLRAIEPYRHHWCLPGGHIDKDEPAREAIIREVKEEVGLDFEPQFFRYFDEITGCSPHAIVLVFSGEASGELVSEPGEVTASQWFDIPEALKLDLAFGHKGILEAYSGATG